MTVRERLLAIADLVGKEAERNPAFRQSLEVALGLGLQDAAKPRVVSKARAGRRQAAVLDPVELARQDEAALRPRLEALGLEQLRDIVAQHAMDPGKLVMRWKTPGKVTDHIVELAVARARKGEAFGAD